MDYAKRAAKLVQCESNNGYWLTSIDGRYLADGHGENAADVTEQIRAWLAAELQAAHDAGVAEAAPKWTPITDDKATWPGPSKNVVANDAYGDRRAMTNDQYRKWRVTQDAKERLCRFGLVPEARMSDETILRVHDALLSSGVPGYATGPEKPEKEER